MIRATGKAYDPSTREWTKEVITEHADRMAALRWINFNREWMKDLRIID